MMKSQFRTVRFAMVLALIAAVSLMSVAALANGHGKMPTKEAAPRHEPAPAMMGRGPTTVTITTATASSLSNCAWIYTAMPTNCAPVQTPGMIQVTATKGPVGEPAVVINDRAHVVATFNYPASGACTYTVRFTSLASAGQFKTPFGGIAFERQMFGDAKWLGLDIPPTVAYVAVLGLATIMKGDDVVATNQPAIAAVTQAIHDDNHKLMAQADSSRKEMHLIVPGPLVEGASSVPGFPNGYFYIYWPSAQFSIDKEQITIPGEAVAPATLGRGPEVTKGTLHIELTNRGIHKTVGTAPFGLYEITVRNTSDKWQGLFMTGRDICCSDYKRFSTILKPGASQKFRWFFGAGKVVMRPFCCAIKVPTSYDDYRWTGPATSLVFE
ncbi:MAG: hypothetical protein ACYC64_12805 [Armatimonadota bacterium]